MRDENGHHRAEIDGPVLQHWGQELVATQPRYVRDLKDFRRRCKKSTSRTETRSEHAEARGQEQRDRDAPIVLEFAARGIPSHEARLGPAGGRFRIERGDLKRLGDGRLVPRGGRWFVHAEVILEKHRPEAKGGRLTKTVRKPNPPFPRAREQRHRRSPRRRAQSELRAAGPDRGGSRAPFSASIRPPDPWDSRKRPC